MGKADLGKTLSEATGRTHLSVGHLLREEARKESERARMINEAILMGVLVASVCMNRSYWFYVVNSSCADRSLAGFYDSIIGFGIYHLRLVLPNK